MARPATTGGNAMPVFTTLRTTPRERNTDSASTVPSGSPIRRLIDVATPDTASESRVICSRSSMTFPARLRRYFRSASFLPASATKSACPYLALPNPPIRS